VLTPKRRRLKPGEKVALSLTLAQVDLIVENTFLGEGLLSTIHAARVQDNTVHARCTLGDLEELAGCVAAKAKESQDRELQKELGAISEAISKVEQAYYYDLSPSGTARGMKLVRIENA
jgi:hypothetical protein